MRQSCTIHTGQHSSRLICKPSAPPRTVRHCTAIGRMTKAALGSMAPAVSALPQAELVAVLDPTSSLDPATPAVNTAFANQLNDKLDKLHTNREAWQSLPIKMKVALLREFQGRLLDRMYTLGKCGAAITGQEDDKYIKHLITTLEAIDKTGKCPEVPTRTTASGQVIALVQDGSDPMSRCKAELYIQPGKPATQGKVYVGNQREGGKVTAVLGAGNYGFLGLKDVLYVLFECNNVALLKPHPLQAKWQEVADYLMEPFTSAGFYQSIYTDSVQDTHAMLHHPSVQAVHMTGGTATHDCIVWGSTPEEQQRRKASNDPVLKVPITSELGCVTPWIVTPGEWTEAQLYTQACDAANGLFINNGCACNSLKVLVLPESWPQADAFLSKIKDVFRKLPAQPAFYPGHKARYNAWHAMFPDAEVVQGVKPAGKSEEELLPLLIQEVPFPEPGAELTKQQQYAFTVEPFAPVLTVVRVPAADPTDFMSKATQFANNTVWGTLSCVVLLHPDMEKDHPKEVQQMLDDLEFGAVSVNAYSGLSYAIPHAPWGAFAGNQSLADVGSGMGSINNTLMFDYPQKVVTKLDICGPAVPQPAYVGPLPSWAYGPLTGLLVGGFRGVLTAIFRSQ